MTTAERVRDILTSSGYRELPQPLHIGALPFEFAHALVAEERALDLVIVADLASEKDERRLVQKVHSLARALDVMGSRRPLTTVLASGQPSLQTLDALSRVCRALPVGAPTGPSAEQTLRDWLAVLLPLPALDPISALADWRAEMAGNLSKTMSQDELARVVQAAEGGKAHVENYLAEQIASIVDPLLEEGAS